MNYKVAIFDFDGTLADSFPWFRQVFGELAAEFGLKRLSDAEYEAARGLDTPALLRVLGVPLWKLPRLAVRMRALALRDRNQIGLFAGVPEMLRRLREANVRAGIVSSNSEAVVREVLGAENSALVTEFACGASMFGKAARLRAVARRAKVRPGEAIYIGDEIRDAAAAREAGMDFGAVAWGYASFAALLEQKPERAFRAMDEIFPQARIGAGVG